MSNVNPTGDFVGLCVILLKFCIFVQLFDPFLSLKIQHSHLARKPSLIDVLRLLYVRMHAYRASSGSMIKFFSCGKGESFITDLVPVLRLNICVKVCKGLR